MAKLCFGIDIGGTSVKIGLFTIKGEVLDKWEVVTRKENHGVNVLGDIIGSLNEKMGEKSILHEDIKGIGIGVPGPITADGTVLKCSNLGWDIFNVAEEVTRLTGFKTKVANDANVAALGEMWKGGGKGYKNVIMVTLGTGVGGGVIINGEILPGNNGAAGEIGHITVNYDEENTCGCGKKGCVEQYASATGIVREAKKLLDFSDQPSTLRNIEKLSAKSIFDASREGDKLAREAVDILGRSLGIVLSHVAAIVDPEVFVIGGGVSKAGEELITLIKHYYEQYVIYALKNKNFKLAELGNDAGIYGAAKMIIDL